jgi:phosphoribosylcarboxyaminoimidazole (NCAIR) mutase
MDEISTQELQIIIGGDSGANSIAKITNCEVKICEIGVPFQETRLAESKSNGHSHARPSCGT